MKRRAVFLDIGWTLIYPERSVWHELATIATDLGQPISAGSCEATIHPVWQMTQRQAAFGFQPDAEYTDSDDEFIGGLRRLGHATLVGAGVEEPPREVLERFVRFMSDWDTWRVYPDVMEVLEQLRRDGWCLVAVSNAASDLPEFLAHLGLAEHLDFIVVSAIEGTKKPDGRLFRRALERADVAAVDAFHVGDFALEDVLGPRSVGISAALMHRGSLSLFPSFPPELPGVTAGTQIVADLVALRAILP